MAETLDVIRTRRSVRKFKPDMVPADVLDKVLEAGTWAPTGMGRQSPVILCVTDKAVRDELARMNREIMIETGMGVKRGMDPFYGAPVVCAVLVDAAAPTGRDDGNLVIENMLLAAADLGLGGCYIYRAKEEFERPEGKGILKKAGIEGDYVGVGHVILGYPDMTPKAAPRKENYIYRL